MRGLRTKSHTFLEAILCNNFDVLCITESWLNDNFYNAEYFDDRYEVFRCDRSSAACDLERGGGVIIAVRRELQPWHRVDMRASPPAEELWVSLPLRVNTGPPSTAAPGSAPRYLHLVCTYIAHSSNHELLLSRFYDRVSEYVLCNPDDVFVVLGDFNISHAHWFKNNSSMDIETNNNNLACLTADFMNLTSMSQFNSQFNQNGRILDLIFCNDQCHVSSCRNPLVPEDPHHKSLVIDINLNIAHTLRPSKTMKLQFHKADYDSIKAGLTSIDWVGTLTNLTDVESMVNCFYKIINDLVDKHVPKSNLFLKQKYPPWFTMPLIKLFKEKNKFHKKWKQYGNQQDYQIFSTLRARFKKKSDHCYRQFIELSEDNINKNPKLFWSFVKSKKSTGDFPANMSYNDRIISTGSEICDAFNHYFHSVFILSSAERQPVSIGSHQSVLDINSIDINTSRVLSELKHVNIQKGAGSDNIHPILIRTCAEELAEPLTIIFRASLASGVFPSKWKTALVTPIPKNNQRHLITEYRPISKLSTLGKIFEKMVTADLALAARNFITSQQHGFYRHRSVDSNMVTFTEFLAQAMDKNTQVDVVYTDFSRAFDKINHNTLITKLAEAGVHGSLLRWIESYIKNRSQAVCIKGYSSQFLPVPSGIPQGSHLGPLLFSFYINDIGDVFEYSNYLLYADDTKLYRIVKSHDDCDKLQTDIDRLIDYCSKNQLFLNIKKCNVISYTRKKKPINFNYHINNNIINRVTRIRDLGVIMDSELSFNSHIDHVVGAAFRRLGFILRISKPFKNTNTLKILYFSFVRSILDFCSTVWNPCYSVHINRVERIQKKFIKSLNYRNNTISDSYNEALKKHNLLTLSDRRKMYDIIFLYKILNSLIDSSELLGSVKLFCRVRLPVRSSRTIPLFETPRRHKNYTRNSFLRRSTNTYNKEFLEIDLFNTSLNACKLKLKTALS